MPVDVYPAPTQPVSGSVSLTGAIPAGSNVIGHVIADSGSTTAVTGNVATTSAAASQADGHSISIGSTTDSAASSDTGTFSLIALFKRLLSKLTTQLPAALGANGGLKIEGVASGTAVPVNGTVTASNVTGNVAHDGVDSGNPLLAGYQAIAHGTNPTAVAAADRTVGYANRAGVPFVMGGHPNIITRRDNFTSAQTNVALVTIATGLKIVVTRVLITCANSNSVDVSCTVGFGTASTPTGAGVVADHPGIPKGGGLNTGDGSGILGVGADNEDLRITCSVPTGGSISVVTSYYTIES